MLREATTESDFNIESGTLGTLHESASAVSWGAILAGGVAAAALSLLLLAFGAGVGFSAISPWSTTAASTGFHVATGLYFIVTAMIASSVGGYLAGRLRKRWTGAHTREVFFRDTAHGFLAWSFATLLSASLLASAAGGIVSGGTSAITNVAGQAPGLLDVYVDALLLRAQVADGGTAPADVGSAGTTSERVEVGRILAASLETGSSVSTSERTYLAQLVAARTGLSEAQAQERVASTIAQARVAADKARKGAAQLALWLTASLLVGAFAASLAALEGGGLRDGTWKYQV